MTTLPRDAGANVTGAAATGEAVGATTPALDPATAVGLLALGVADLDRSLAYYTDAFGLALLARDGARATLGAGGVPLLLLTAEPGARPWPHDRYGYTGLYHFALLVPTRADLGRWLRHWLALGMALPGQGDHLVSEALYITDPDGNGIEIYRDRPRGEWQWEGGRVRMAADPVDIAGVLAEGDRTTAPWTGLAPGTRLGHMHLQVGDVARAEAFYSGVLGFDVVARMPTALFVSAGGYHHHIGMNVWHSRNADPAPAGVAGLRFYTIVLPTAEARAAVVARVRAAGVDATPAGDAAGDVVLVRDPWRNTLLLTVGTTTDVADADALRAAVA